MRMQENLMNNSALSKAHKMLFSNVWSLILLSMFRIKVLFPFNIMFFEFLNNVLIAPKEKGI